jgi:hypothetical protein
LRSGSFLAGEALKEKIMITMTKKQAKALVSGLKRTLKENGTTVSHSAAGELVAKSLGFRTWEAFQVTLLEDSAHTDQTAPARYPLSNTGQFDFSDEGVLLVGSTFLELAGTAEDIFDSVAAVTEVTRMKNGETDLVYGGETDVNWDSQKTRLDPRGFRIWIQAENCQFISEDRCVIVPEDEAAAIDLEDPNIELKVRPALVEALVTYLQETAKVIVAIRELLEDLALTSLTVDAAETMIGFSATHPERAELLKALQAL